MPTRGRPSQTRASPPPQSAMSRAFAAGSAEGPHPHHTRAKQGEGRLRKRGRSGPSPGKGGAMRAIGAAGAGGSARFPAGDDASPKSPCPHGYYSTNMGRRGTVPRRRARGGGLWEAGGAGAPRGPWRPCAPHARAPRHATRRAQMSRVVRGGRRAPRRGGRAGCGRVFGRIWRGGRAFGGSQTISIGGSSQSVCGLGVCFMLVAARKRTKPAQGHVGPPCLPI